MRRIPKKEYNEYMNSPEWAQISNEILERDNHICQTCGSNKSLEVHHLSYKNWKHEYPAELVTLCFSCHNKIHFLSFDKLGFKLEQLNPNIFDFYSDTKNEEAFERIFLPNNKHAEILSLIWNNLILVYKRYNGKNKQFCPRNISVTRSKYELNEIYKDFLTNPSWRELYKDLKLIIQELPMDAIITSNIKTRQNLIAYSTPNIKLLDLMCCKGEGIVRQNTKIKKVDELTGEKEEVKCVQFKRTTKNKQCEYFSELILIKYCKKCGKEFPENSVYCDMCVYSKKSKWKKKGEPFVLGYKRHKPPICNCIKFKLRNEWETDVIEIKHHSPKT